MSDMLVCRLMLLFREIYLVEVVWFVVDGIGFWVEWFVVVVFCCGEGYGFVVVCFVGCGWNLVSGVDDEWVVV